MKTSKFFATLFALICATGPGLLAQMPQDYWYFNGLTIPGNFGAICAGPDGNLYAATNYSSNAGKTTNAISVFTTNGAFVWQFGTNLNVGGIAIDSQTNIYVLNLNSPSGFVNKFSPSGTLLFQFGAQGTNTSQLKEANTHSGIAVGIDQNVYVADNGNSRVQVYDPNGNYLASWSNVLNDLTGIVEIAPLPGGNFAVYGSDGGREVTSTGNLVSGNSLSFGASSPDGLLCDIYYVGPYLGYDTNVLSIDEANSGHAATIILTYPPVRVTWNNNGTNSGNTFDANSTLYGTGTNTNSFGSMASNTTLIFGMNRYFGPNQPLNPAPVPVPYFTSVQQRTNSSLIDIAFTVQDAATNLVTTAIVAFNNGKEDFGDLIPMTLFAGGTATNLGPNIAANVSHTVTWDASEATSSFANFQFDILAADQRGLLNLHFITVPATATQPAVTISSGPVPDTSLFNLWLWLIATNNPSIMLTNGNVVGVGGAFDQQTLASGASTTAQGRLFLYPLLKFRAPTAAEISQAKSGNFGFSSVSANSLVLLP